MSIFDPESGMNPLPWLQEKTLSALESAARLADLANEPDTTDWYRRNLKEHASRLIGRLAPIVALLHEAGPAAAEFDSWSPIVEGGSFALTGWCKSFGIESTAAAMNALAGDPDEDGYDDKAEAPPDEPNTADDDGTEWKRLTIYGGQARRMLHEDLPEPARRLLLWLLQDLYMSSWADAVVVSRRFLPGDIGASREDTAEAYRYLYDNGFIERIDTLSKPDSDRLALRIVVPGINDSKHAAPYREEEFGFEGATVGGKRTWGNHVLLELPGALSKVVRSWRLSDDDLAQLKGALQEMVGPDRVYIEEVGLAAVQEDTYVRVRVRTPFDSDDRELNDALTSAAETWLRKHTAVGGTSE